MNNYFLITGLNEGKPIEPYMVETDADYPMLPSNEFGDSVRYYEQLSESQVIQNMKKGIELL